MEFLIVMFELKRRFWEFFTLLTFSVKHALHLDSFWLIFGFLMNHKVLTTLLTLLQLNYLAFEILYFIFVFQIFIFNNSILLFLFRHTNAISGFHWFFLDFLNSRFEILHFFVVVLVNPLNFFFFLSYLTINLGQMIIRSFQYAKFFLKFWSFIIKLLLNFLVLKKSNLVLKLLDILFHCLFFFQMPFFKAVNYILWACPCLF